jgi:plasmid stabilization system protein ParE
MNRSIILHSEAEAEILGALAWYQQRSGLAARAFVQELTHVVRLAAQSPGTWPLHIGNTRRVVFPRFPFSLVFRMRGEAVEVVALAHQRRRPDYWDDR